MIDPADMEGLESALDKNKVSRVESNFVCFQKFSLSLVLMTGYPELSGILIPCRFPFSLLSLLPIHSSDLLILSWFQSFAIGKGHWYA